MRFESRESRVLAAAPYAVFLLLSIVSWNRWIEPYVDSGRELMVPLRLAQGERLYRDVAFYHGPLGPFLAAGVELLANPSLPARTLLAALVALLHLEGLRRLARLLVSPRRAALMACLAVALAGFLRPGGWLFPFSLDASIAVAALTWALTLTGGEPSAKRDRAAGACIAIALLARPELGAAGLTAVVLQARGAPRRWLTLAGWPLAAAGVGYAAVSWGIPVRMLINSGWLAFIDPPPAFARVYRAYAGLDQPGARLQELALAVIGLLGVGALLAVAAKAAGTSRKGGVAAVAITSLALAALAAVSLRPPEELVRAFSLWPPFVRAAPTVVLALAIARVLSALARRPGRPLPGVPDGVLFLSAVFGLRLLLAAGYAGPYNAYFLPLPALVAAAALFRVADRASDSLGPSLPHLAATALGVLLLFRIAALTDQYRRGGWGEVTTTAGALLLPEPVAETTSLALADLAGRLRPGGTLVGFPEGGFFNYVLRQRTPLREEQFFPDRLDNETEKQVIRHFEQSPPDAVLLLNVIAVGEGARAFGADYLRDLGAAVKRRCPVAAAYGPGAVPGASIGDPQFFIEVRVPRGGVPRGEEPR